MKTISKLSIYTLKFIQRLEFKNLHCILEKGGKKFSPGFILRFSFTQEERISFLLQRITKVQASSATIQGLLLNQDNQNDKAKLQTHVIPPHNLSYLEAFYSKVLTS